MRHHHGVSPEDHGIRHSHGGHGESTSRHYVRTLRHHELLSARVDGVGGRDEAHVGVAGWHGGILSTHSRGVRYRDEAHVLRALRHGEMLSLGGCGVWCRDGVQVERGARHVKLTIHSVCVYVGNVLKNVMMKTSLVTGVAMKMSNSEDERSGL